ncbi:MAG: hypothetical protein GX594_09360 [Pirellulaceae bacterium]|nr:hypothetical protein [Pirellulaceae bacterium]
MWQSMRRGILTTIVATALFAGCDGAAFAQAAPSNDRHAAPALTPRQADSDARAERKPAGLPTISVVGSLALVLGVFFLGMWLFRRTAPAVFGVLPPEAFEQLGRARLNARHQVHLLRCGDKVLLVAVGAVGAAGAATLTEISDPAEVERLTALCRRPRSGCAAAGLCQALRGGEARNDG